MLFLRRGGTDEWRGLWWLPGGACESGEGPFEAAAREVVEETGLRLDASELVSLASTVAHKPCGEPRGFELYLADHPGGRLRLSDEHDAATWAHPAWFFQQPLAAFEARSGLIEGWLNQVALPFIDRLSRELGQPTRLQA